MDYPENMPPADIDAMLHHVSNQMTRSQLFRRLSANSNNSSPGRRGNTRVAKAHSNGATPQGVQRRRTTAAHTVRTKPPSVQPSDPLQPMPQTASTTANETRRIGSSSSTRPMTWHPGSYPLEFCQEENSRTGTVDMQIPLTHQQTGYTGTSNYASQSSFAQTSSFTDQAQYPTGVNCLQPALEEHSFYPSSYFEYPLQPPHQDYDDPYNYGAFSAGLGTTSLPQMPPDYSFYSTQQTPESFDAQDHTHLPQCVQAPVQASMPRQLTKQRSKELIGLGLYDGPSRTELSKFNLAPDHISQLMGEPQGKGLKLEETWQPPKDDEKDAEEEGYSTDDGEDDLPPAPAPKESQPTFIPNAYDDLSNQSFFFDSDDPYADYLSFDPCVAVCQPKIPDGLNQNLMWL
ncbi:MAG: hypothetical protein Q9223_006056 [Gallowayella weberi]